MPATRKQKFIPISELLQSPPRRLTVKQREVIDAHETAKAAMATFLESKKPRTIGITVRGMPPVPSAEEFSASNRAMGALRIAIEYYHQHGKLWNAFTEIREVARQHWHPVIDSLWGHHFQRRADDAGIPIPLKLASRLRGAMGEIFATVIEDSELIERANDPKRRKEKSN